MTTAIGDSTPRDGGSDRARGPRSGDRRLTKVSIRRGVRVILPQGAFDESVAAEVGTLIDAHDGPAVVDLGECLLTSIDLLQLALTSQLERRMSRLAVACRRGTGRRMLQRAGIDRRLAVFLSVEDAIQAHLFRRAGIGPGWGAPPSGGDRPRAAGPGPRMDPRQTG